MTNIPEHGFIKPLAIFMLIWLFTSCSSDRNRSSQYVIEVDPTSFTEINLNDCKSVVISDTTLLIGVIRQALSDNNYHYIHSNYKLFLFDKDGRFICKIGERGRAGNEYSSLHYFWLEGESIYLYDFNGGKIFNYSTNNELLSTNRISRNGDNEYAFTYIVPLKDGYLGRCVWDGVAGISPALAYYSSDFKFEHTIGDLSINSGLRLGFPLTKSKDGALYWNPFGNKIYFIDDTQTVSTRYTISFGKYSFPDLASYKDDYDVLDLAMNEDWRRNHAGSFSYVFENDNITYFIYGMDDKMHILKYNCKTHRYNNFRLETSDDETIQSCSSDGKNIYIYVESEKGLVIYNLGK
ncbi:MAG: 6-bladed beta-propeller [Bacteroidales bacterium]|nr:6-bladed beta-propeller [Bacteroidales bacterium]